MCGDIEGYSFFWTAKIWPVIPPSLSPLPLGYVLKLIIVVKLSRRSGGWVGQLMGGTVGGWTYGWYGGWLNLQAVRWVGHHPLSTMVTEDVVTFSSSSLSLTTLSTYSYFLAWTFSSEWSLTDGVDNLIDHIIQSADISLSPTMSGELF